jgi:hypothetical protein
VEKVGKFNTWNSTPSHKAEVLPEAEGEGPQRKRRRTLYIIQDDLHLEMV